MGLARSVSYDFLTALTIDGQFVPQSTDLHNAILPPTQPQGCCSSKLTPQLKLTIPLRCPIVPGPLTEIRDYRYRPPTTAFHSTRRMAYGEAKPRCSIYISPLVRSAVTEKHTAPERRRNPAAAVSSDSTPRSNPRPMTTSNTCRKLASLILCHPSARHLSPPSDAKCPTVHRSAANPSIVNPRR